MPRIIGGSARGRRITAPPGDATRPTADRVREALFSSVVAEAGALDGWSVLDLYAGSGAIGLEARSRGAAQATFVEAARGVATMIRANAAAAGLTPVDVVAMKVTSFLRSGPPVNAPYDLVFADPPYDLPDEELATVLGELTAPGWLAPDALVVVERATRRGSPAWPTGLVESRSRRYGEGTLWYARLSAGGAPPAPDHSEE